jgi:hypothetical protein
LIGGWIIYLFMLIHSHHSNFVMISYCYCDGDVLYWTSVNRDRE